MRTRGVSGEFAASTYAGIRVVEFVWKDWTTLPVGSDGEGPLARQDLAASLARTRPRGKVNDEPQM